MNNIKTFREVIRDIKEGETWENLDENRRVKQIYLTQSGVISFKGEEILRDLVFVSINLNDKYKLKRKTYSFNEAFKAYEKGKEIESLDSEFKYKIINSQNLAISNIERYTYEKQGYIFNDWSIEEIRGEWCIND